MSRNETQLKKSSLTRRSPLDNEISNRDFSTLIVPAKSKYGPMKADPIASKALNNLLDREMHAPSAVANQLSSDLAYAEIAASMKSDDTEIADRLNKGKFHSIKD